MATINDVLTAYDLAVGEWKGCNWPTHYGNLGLDLKGMSRCPFPFCATDAAGVM